jgi:uncharacterized protein
MICYLDSSALVKLLVDEPGTAEVSRAVKEAELVGTVTVSRAEVVAALAKAVRVGALSMDDSRSARHRFRTEWLHFLRLQVSDFLIDRAGDLAWAYGLRGYDSVQLAASDLWRESLDAPVSFATFDLKLWKAAAAVGLVPYPQDLPVLLESLKT